MVGVYPNDAALCCLAGPSLLETNDEWLVTRRYLSLESLEPVLEGVSGPRTLEVVTLAKR
mgnify:CR=1 FL=1